MRLKAIWAILTSRSFVVVSDGGILGKYKTLSVPAMLKMLERTQDQLKYKAEIEQEEYERQK